MLATPILDRSLLRHFPISEFQEVNLFGAATKGLSKNAQRIIFLITFIQQHL